MTEPLWLTACQECATIIDNGDKPDRWWKPDNDNAWVGGTTNSDTCDICMNSSDIYYEIGTLPYYGKEQG